MKTEAIQIDNVYYNAANQCFEGLVTIHQDGATRRYATAISAPITMSFEDAAAGLGKQAMRRHKDAGGTLYSETLIGAAKQRFGRRNFNVRTWLAGISNRPGIARAA